MHPLRIHHSDPDLLEIDWQDGTRSAIAGRDLRRHCPCSECQSKARTASARFIPLVSDLSGRIAAVDLVGSSAIHVLWADGHMRSIYRYDHLRTIAPPRSPEGSAE